MEKTIKTIRIGIYTSFGKKYVIYFSSMDMVSAFESEISNNIWVVIYPIGSNARVKLATSSIMALEVFQGEKINKEEDEE